ncbi:predicted protein [Naegleria gruberi]|uniref:Predicted protein n=1 Tax=Naegleria gruberi TaxID=5762 RepID=D2VN17_NAEGR|nr:uncharacterized protein NAEGRDRAFT_44674 [Naegleria gruberi]EFC41917.1 predicted protein [Naegleria gruberi]|eukprot:XP_002674661.1 predicted protein [Naegleria gruberi strain NEG-M]
MASDHQISEDTFLFQEEIAELIKLLKQIPPSNNLQTILKSLISNSSDALDRIKYASLSDSSVLLSEPQLFIKIIPDLESKSLSIIDSGFGMSRNDLVLNLGGSLSKRVKLYVELLKQGDKSSVMERFGNCFGFNLAFMIAEKVVVSSKMHGNEQFIWKSSGDGVFKVASDTSSEQLTRGTRVTLYLNEDSLVLLDNSFLKMYLTVLSKPIRYPVLLQTLDENNEQKCEFLNKDQPLWTRDPEKISKSEYLQFYKEMSNDWEDYLTMSHYRVEGILEFKLLLFIPKVAHFNYELVSHLYIRSTFIMDNCKYIVPDYLDFMRVLVDSEDLPLNLYQFSENKILKVIRKRVTRATLQMFERLAENKDDYKNFYQNFGRKIKMGVILDDSNRLLLTDLLRFHSNCKRTEWSSLRDYCSRMMEGQTFIYFLLSIETNINEVLIEQYSKKGLEVLLLSDPIDKIVIETIKDFNGTRFLEISMNEE